MKRIGVVGIVVKGDRSVVTEMQRVLSDFADIIAGRMGVPRSEYHCAYCGGYGRENICADGQARAI